MEETPDSGLAEEIQRSQNDIGAFTWGPDASTDRVSQEITSGGFGEDSACLSEAEQDIRLSTRLLSSADWPTVAEQGEHAPGPALPGGNEQLPPKPAPEAGVTFAPCVEMEQPYDPLDSDMPAVDTAGLFKESHEDVKKSDEEEEKQKIEDSLWAGVETCQKVDTGAIDIKTLEGTEEFEEKACERTGNRVVDLNTIGKEAHKTLKINEVETRKDVRAGYKESINTNENYFEKTDLLEKDMERGDMAKELSDRDQGLHDGIQKVIKNCEMIGGFGAKPANHPDILNPSLQTYSVSKVKNGSPEGWDFTREDIKKNAIDTPNHDMIYYPAQDSTDAEETQCETVLNALVGDSDKNQAVLSIKVEVEAQSRTDLNYSLGSDANRRDLCSCKAESSLIEESERTVTENCSHTVNLPRTAEIDSWGTDPGQIWQPSLDSALNNLDITGFSGIPDGQASGFANCLDSINHGPIRDTEGLDNSWTHLDIVEHKEELEVDLLAGVCRKQAIASCWEQSQEIARPLILGTSRNASTESSASSRDQDINNSDLSEDEIANQRYGLLYQEIEADKDEASGGSFNGFTQPQDTSLFAMQTDQSMICNLAESEQAPPTEPKAEEPLAAVTPAVGLDLGMDTRAEEPVEEAVIIPGADADAAVGTLVSAAEGAPGEEAEAEKATLPAGEGVSLEEAKIGTETEGAESAQAEAEELAATVPQEKVIPSVVIEPASNHEEEGEHEITIGAEPEETTEDTAPLGPTSETPELATEPKPLQDPQPMPSAPALGTADQLASVREASQELPPGFLYKVETLHDFEAANSDELTLQRGDVVLVVPSDSEADQDAGWLVGVKESDWLQYRDLATYKGLFPENFTRRLD
nr:amphiphysin isoform X9 [Macaca fascicularis]